MLNSNWLGYVVVIVFASQSIGLRLNTEVDYFGEADDIIPPRNTSNYNSPDYSITYEDVIPSATVLRTPFLDSKWPNATVPYIFHHVMGKHVRSQVVKAMEEYHRHSCVRFKQWDGEADYLVIGYSNSSGCASLVGRQGGRQQLHLSPWCARSVGVAMHELMHALGFVHEHMRPDRDRYVYINYSNIDRALWKNFETVRPGIMFNDLGAGYDFSSLMHYRVCAMTNNNLPTIIPKVDPGTKFIGQRKGFSRSDIIKLNKFYNCSSLSRNLELFPAENNIKNASQHHKQHCATTHCNSSVYSKSSVNQHLFYLKIIYLVYTHKHFFFYIYVKCFIVSKICN